MSILAFLQTRNSFLNNSTSMSQSDFLLLHQYISSNSIPRVKSLLKSKRIKVSDYDPYDTDLSPLLFYAIKYATDDNGELLDYFLENNNGEIVYI